MTDQETISSQARTLLDKLLRHAQFLRADRGAGRLVEVDALSGRGPGYFARVLSGEIAQCDLWELLKLVLSLGLDPLEFFVEGLGFSTERYLWELERQNRHQVGYLKKRLRWATAGGEATAAEVLGERVSALEERRMLEREAVKREAFELWGILWRAGSTPEVVAHRCEVLGVLGAVCRTQGALSSAAYCLREALRLASWLAGEGGAEAASRGRARTLRRVACLLCDQGELETASTVVEAAGKIYRQLADPRGVARTLVDLGSVAGKRGLYEAAIASFGRGLEALGKDDWRYRFTAFQGLGLCHLKLGDVEKASESLDRAVRESGKSGTRTLASFTLWLRGKIRFESGDLEGAEKDLREVRRILLAGPANPVDLALVTLELARVLYRARKGGDELKRLLRELMPLVGRLGKSPLVVAAIEELLVTAMRGEASGETIERASLKARRGAHGQTSLTEPEAAFGQPLGSGQGPVS